MLPWYLRDRGKQEMLFAELTVFHYESVLMFVKREEAKKLRETDCLDASARLNLNQMKQQ